jgi:hypothetical protein
VGQQIANRDTVLPPFRKLGNERGDWFVNMQLVLFLQKVNQHGGDGL